MIYLNNMYVFDKFIIYIYFGCVYLESIVRIYYIFKFDGRFDFIFFIGIGMVLFMFIN